MIPIPDAITLVRAKVYAAVSSIAPTYNGHPACYWLEAERGVIPPYIVMQSQDNGGLDDSMLGRGGWTGLITIKATSLDVRAGGGGLAAAEALLVNVPAAIEAIADPSGYSLSM